MIVIDASALIAALDSHDAHHKKAQQLLGDTTDLGIHPLTLAEILVLPVKEQRGQAVLDAISKTCIKVLSAEIITPLDAATARAATGLKLPDAVVLATAQALKAGIVTFDLRLAAAANRMGIETSGVEEQLSEP
ncbi:MAG: PIN domain-containing protein [Propionibacteriaceae bacterium]|jgi:predicted nucleic acid-binding protein|nr:PIN domain-containing protein [Propionibacteriaceae bacterium]